MDTLVKETFYITLQIEHPDRPFETVRFRLDDTTMPEATDWAVQRMALELGVPAEILRRNWSVTFHEGGSQTSVEWAGRTSLIDIDNEEGMFRIPEDLLAKYEPVQLEGGEPK
jgi:hypothetical protein